MGMEAAPSIPYLTLQKRSTLTMQLIRKQLLLRIIVTLVGSGIITGILIVGAVVSFKRFHGFVDAMYFGNTAPIGQLANERASEVNLRRLAWLILAERDEQLTAASLVEMEQWLKLFESNRQRYRSAMQGASPSHALSHELGLQHPQFADAIGDVMYRLRQGDYVRARTALVAHRDFMDRFDRLISDALNANISEAAALEAESASMMAEVFWISLCSFGLVVIMVAASALFLMRRRDEAKGESRHNQKILEEMFNKAVNGVILTNHNGVIERVNPAFTELTGYAEAEVVGRNPSMWSSGRQSAEFYRGMWGTLKETGRWEGQLWNRKKSGTLYLESISIVGIPANDGDFSHYAAMFTDITQRHMNEEYRNHLATHDVLTGLPNRLLFKERMAHAVVRAHRTRTKVAVMFVDLDHFKQINDTLGHGAGDITLTTVAERLRGGLRESDTVARLGGDEFAIVLEDVTKTSDVGKIASALLDAVGQPIQLEAQPVAVTPSIGISLYPDDATDPKVLVACADRAMYAAKRDGKNACRFYHDVVDVDVEAEACANTSERLGLSG